ncbi:MAG: argininosuccinate lyase, partial [Planctomycetaceae bacterium]|nr:argininosuccinate lyase [Planctomycetaceae bacterium]
DVLELIRGKTARVVGAATQLMVLVKGLPLAYNRDLQEDKLAAFAAIDTVTACLELTPHIVAKAKLQRERIDARLEDGFLDATALMEYLIRQGVPMRSGHEIVGKLVALCEKRGCRLKDLPLDELREASPQIDQGVYDCLGARAAMAALVSYGSGGETSVGEQLARWRERVADGA